MKNINTILSTTLDIRVADISSNLYKEDKEVIKIRERSNNLFDSFVKKHGAAVADEVDSILAAESEVYSTVKNKIYFQGIKDGMQLKKVLE